MRDTSNRPGRQPGILRQLAQLDDLTTAELKERWRALYANEPPRFNRQLLIKRLAYRIYAMRGIYLGPVPFGYFSQTSLMKELMKAGASEDLARTTAKRRMPLTLSLAIHPDEAVIAGVVFLLFSDFHPSTRKVVNGLNTLGLLRRGRPWQPRDVLNLLRDPKVAGWVTFDEEAYQAKRPSSAPIPSCAKTRSSHLRR